MAQRDTKIVLDLTGDGGPTVHRQDAPNGSTETNDETDSRVWLWGARRGR